MDEHEAIQALRRLTDLWEPWYKIRRDNGLWHAKRRDSGDQFHAASPEKLNADLILHFMGDMRLASLGLAQEVPLAEVRRKHGTLWGHIGPDTDTPGWRASREVGEGDGDETHHVVCRTLADLDAALTALEAPDENGALN